MTESVSNVSQTVRVMKYRSGGVRCVGADSPAKILYGWCVRLMKYILPENMVEGRQRHLNKVTNFLKGGMNVLHETSRRVSADW